MVTVIATLARWPVASVTTMVHMPAATGVTVIEAAGPLATAGENVAIPVQLVGAAVVTENAPA